MIKNGNTRAPRRRAAKTERGTLSALVWEGEGTPCVLFHGGFENAHAWRAAATGLEQPVVALDLPGCGHSDPVTTGTYWPADIAHWTAESVRQVVGSPAHFVGFSYGGLLALSTADIYPGSVCSLTLVDVIPGVCQRHSQRVVQALNRGLYMGPDGDTCISKWTPVPADMGETLWGVMRRLRVPTTLLVGEHSKVVLDSDLEILRQVSPDSEVRTIPGCGHNIPCQAPDAVICAIEQMEKRVRY